MSSTIKNIIILVVVAIVLVLVYIFFLKPAPEQAPLTTSSGAPVTATVTSDPITGSEFLAVLLSVKSLRLDDAIFSDPAYISLHDSSIELITDTTEGRPNPFAPIGSDVSTVPINTLAPTSTTTTIVPTTTTTTTKITP
ncbi:MAG: hypothetical protein WAV23_00060 [Minisyncoccia bacterium]